MNTVTRNKQTEERVPVGNLKAGTLVSWYEEGDIFVVLKYKNNPANIAAVSLSDGGFLTSNVLVTPLLKGEVLNIVTGETE